MSNDFWPLWKSWGSISIRTLRLLLIWEAQQVLRRHLLQDGGREIDERVTHKKHALSLHVICCSTTEELKEKIATGCRWFRVRGWRDAEVVTERSECKHRKWRYSQRGRGKYSPESLYRGSTALSFPLFSRATQRWACVEEEMMEGGCCKGEGRWSSSRKTGRRGV